VALFDPARHANTGIAGSRVLVDDDGRVTWGSRRRRGGVAGGSLVSTGACLLEPAVAERMGPGFSDFGADVFPAGPDGVLAAHVIEPGGFCLGLDTPPISRRGGSWCRRGRVECHAERLTGP
jgi:hypothetical protein